MNFVTISRFFLTTFTCVQDIDVIFINLLHFFFILANRWNPERRRKTIARKLYFFRQWY